MLSTCTVPYTSLVRRRREECGLGDDMDMASTGKKLQTEVVQGTPVYREAFNRADQTTCPISSMPLYMFRLGKV